jgi:hypothetical protein
MLERSESNRKNGRAVWRGFSFRRETRCRRHGRCGEIGHEEDLHFPSWHDLIREVMGYDDRSEFQSGNDDLIEY